MNPQTPTDPYTYKKASRLPTIILFLLLIISLVFGIWAYGQMNDYKTKSDAKAAAAVAAAKKTQEAAIRQQYDDAAKSPYKTFQGSATYGTVTFNYPKTWSAYITSDASNLINDYFYPGEVPSIDSGADFPLHVELLTTDYAQAVQTFSSQVTDGSVTATAYVPPKMKGVANTQPGTRFDGAIAQTDTGSKQGTVIVLKVRDKTLQITSLSAAGVKDLDNIVLPSLTFIP